MNEFKIDDKVFSCNYFVIDGDVIPDFKTNDQLTNYFCRKKHLLEFSSQKVESRLNEIYARSLTPEIQEKLTLPIKKIEEIKSIIGKKVFYSLELKHLLEEEIYLVEEFRNYLKKNPQVSFESSNFSSKCIFTIMALIASVFVSSNSNKYKELAGKFFMGGLAIIPIAVYVDNVIDSMTHVLDGISRDLESLNNFLGAIEDGNVADIVGNLRA